MIHSLPKTSTELSRFVRATTLKSMIKSQPKRKSTDA